jgi:hypothetical protein
MQTLWLLWSSYPLEKSSMEEPEIEPRTLSSVDDVITRESNDQEI